MNWKLHAISSVVYGGTTATSARNRIRRLAFLSSFLLASGCGGAEDGGGPASPSATAPRITSDPANATVVLGSPVTFTVVSSGSGPLQFQWKRDGANIPGATASSLNLSGTSKADAGAVFTVVVSNAQGTVTSAGATLTVQWAPQILTDPQSRTVAEWDSTALAVIADASPAPTYQWQRNGQDVTGATGSTLRIPSADLASSGARYAVSVRNAIGTALSREAVITVQRPSPAPFKYRGFNVSSFGTGYWDTPADNETMLQYVRSQGGNMVTLDWMVTFNDDGTMVPGGGSTHEAWANIVQVAARAKALGLYVVLKPHVVTTRCCGDNRNAGNTNTSTFLPSNFFPAWQAYMLEMIGRIGAPTFDAIAIGTEMNFLDWQERERWAALIGTLRKNYSGALTYDAMFSQYLPEKDVGDVVFWDLLDYISCSFYVRLTRDDNAGVEALTQLFRDNPSWAAPDQMRDVIGFMRSLSAKYNKPIMALEGGYQSARGALWDVNASYGANEDQGLQARGLDGYLTAMNISQSGWLQGVSLWDLQPRHFRPATWTDMNYRAGWGMVNKTASEVVRRWYSVR